MEQEGDRPLLGCHDQYDDAGGQVVEVGLLSSSSDAWEELLEYVEVSRFINRYLLWIKAAAWEFKLLSRLSAASIVVSIANFMLSLVTQMFVGQLGALDLAAASIASVGIQGLAYGIMVRIWVSWVKPNF